MRYPVPLLAAALVAACAPSGQVATAPVCPTTDLSGLIGQPLVAVAASADVGPIRQVGLTDPAPVERPERLTLRSDGEGRIAAAFCG